MQVTALNSAWRSGLAGQGSSSQLLHLRHEADLAFVFQVVADQCLGRAFERLPPTNYKVKDSGQRALIYLTHWAGSPTGLQPLWTALRVPPPEAAAASALLVTEDQRSVELIDAAKCGRVETAKILGQRTGQVLTFVSGAESIDEPVPDMYLGYWRITERKSTKRSPYLCSVAVGSFTIGTSSLFTKLSPKWWSMDPAYEIIRSARRGTAV